MPGFPETRSKAQNYIITFCVIVKPHDIAGSVEYPNSGVIATHSIYKSTLRHLAVLFAKFICKSSTKKGGVNKDKIIGYEMQCFITIIAYL